MTAHYRMLKALAFTLLLAAPSAALSHVKSVALKLPHSAISLRGYAVPRDDWPIGFAEALHTLASPRTRIVDPVERGLLHRIKRLGPSFASRHGYGLARVGSFLLLMPLNARSPRTEAALIPIVEEPEEYRIVSLQELAQASSGSAEAAFASARKRHFAAEP